VTSVASGSPADGARGAGGAGGAGGVLDVLRAALLAHEGPALAPVIAGAGLGPYRGYGELLGALARLATRGARLAPIGRSVRGEPLFAVHLGSDRPDARTAVVLAAVHPIEWIGVEVAMALLDRLAGLDLGDRAVIAVPLVNPDGLLRVERDLRAGRRRFVRHNARGVDLNRNFDASWDRRGLAQRLLSFLYAPGAHAGSEPEVAALAHHLASRRVDRAVSLHSFGGAVLYPPAASRRPVLDAAEHRAWARRIAAGAAWRPYRALPCSWWSGGLTQGGLELDWFHERHGALSLLVECSRGGQGRRAADGLHPGRLLQPFAWYNPPAPEEVTTPLVEALVPYVRGAGL
jgi:hypothetical protein